jgi:hypothetical protein
MNSHCGPFEAYGERRTSSEDDCCIIVTFNNIANNKVCEVPIAHRLSPQTVLRGCTGVGDYIRVSTSPQRGFNRAFRLHSSHGKRPRRVSSYSRSCSCINSWLHPSTSILDTNRTPVALPTMDGVCSFLHRATSRQLSSSYYSCVGTSEGSKVQIFRLLAIPHHNAERV